MKSAPVSDQIRYKLAPAVTKEERKKSVTFVCDDKDVSSRDTDENGETNNICDENTEEQNDDEYIAQFMKANNISKTEDENNKLIADEVLYSQERPKRLSVRKASNIYNTLTNPDGNPKETIGAKEDNDEVLKRQSSVEDLMDKVDGVNRLNRNSDEKDVNNNYDENMYNTDRPMRLKRRNTVASISTSMKKLSIGEEIEESESERMRSSVMGQQRKRKSGVVALDPDFRALLEKQNEEKLPKEKLLQRRKSEPAFVLSNFLKSIHYHSDLSNPDDLLQQERNTSEQTCEEIEAEIDRNSNNINALYMAKNKISHALYFGKDKISNRPQTSAQESKPKPRIVGIPYHTEMRMKRKGKITLQLKAIYLDEAEKRAKSAKGKLLKEEFLQKRPSVGVHKV